jgi:ribose 5-phosphate isomerase RpiB
VALCGSGVGASIAANKVAGVRAGLIHDVFSAHQGVEDDFAEKVLSAQRFQFGGHEEKTAVGKGGA